MPFLSSKYAKIAFATPGLRPVQGSVQGSVPYPDEKVYSTSSDYLVRFKGPLLSREGTGKDGMGGYAK